MSADSAPLDLDTTLSLLRRLDWSRERLEEHRTERLRDLLRHASTHSRFWRERLHKLDPSTATPADLSCVPVLRKADLMQHWDEIVTLPGLTLDRCRRHLAALPAEPTPDDFVLEGCLILSTGGTNGHQAIVARERSEWERTSLAQLRWVIRRLLAAGKAPDPDVVRAGVFGDCPRHYAGALTRATGIHPVPVDLPLMDQCARLNQISPKVLLGYSSALARLAAAAIEGHLEIDPLSVTSGGECLTPEIHSLLRRAWPEAWIFDGYGSTETGMLASSSGHPDPSLYINEDLFVLEPLDGSQRVAAPGEQGETLAVTCLEARALPLIRYELTDRATFSNEPSPEGLAFSRIAHLDGRSCDWLRWGDAEVHPYTFTTPLTDDPAVEIYQVRQTQRGAEILVVPAEGASIDELRLVGEIRTGLVRAGLQDPQVHLKPVEAIARVGDGEKHRRFVPLG